MVARLNTPKLDNVPSPETNLGTALFVASPINIFPVLRGMEGSKENVVVPVTLRALRFVIPVAVKSVVEILLVNILTKLPLV